MIQLPEFDSWRQRYADAPLEGLTITAELAPGASILQYNPIYLDNLLGWAVVQQATLGRGLPTISEWYDIPLPLAVIWRSEEGYPLWAASAFFPAGAWAQDTIWLHRRAPSGRWSRSPGKSKPLRIVTSMGRDMERRVPTPAIAAELVQARCIGNADLIGELLEHVTHLGRRRNLGTAHVRRWTIQGRLWEPADVLFTGNQLARAIPEEARHLVPGIINDPPTLIGWTPPQWKATAFRPGWRIGTEWRT